MPFCINLNFSVFTKINNLFAINRYFNTGVQKGRKLEDYFFDRKIQSILKKITGLDYEKVFKPKQQHMVPHKYKFVTDKEFKKLLDGATKRAYDKLQMPPVMDPREPINEILAEDPELQGSIQTKLIFTDTSSSKHSRNRIITVREIDGTLRKANWEERFRMNQTFFPIEGRSMETPKFFESPYLEKLLDEESYLFILDSACVQFEPDDPEYHKVTNTTYEHIKGKKKYDILRSTRHFGPMVFYYALTKSIDALLVDMIERQLICDASDTIKLLYILHPELETSIGEKDDIVCIQEYIKKNKSPQTAILELALQSYIEIAQPSKNENAFL